MKFQNRFNVLANLALVSTVLVCAAAGCGSGGPQTYQVTGKVSFDGQPVKQGDIIFVPEDTSQAPQAGTIVDGLYSLESFAGNCRVQITALDIGPDTEYFEGVPLAKNFIPRWYNEETTLTREVTANNSNKIDFELSSTKPN